MLTARPPRTVFLHEHTPGAFTDIADIFFSLFFSPVFPLFPFPRFLPCSRPHHSSIRRGRREEFLLGLLLPDLGTGRSGAGCAWPCSKGPSAGSGLCRGPCCLLRSAVNEFCPFLIRLLRPHLFLLDFSSLSGNFCVVISTYHLNPEAPPSASSETFSLDSHCLIKRRCAARLNSANATMVGVMKNHKILESHCITTETVLGLRGAPFRCPAHGSY